MKRFALPVLSALAVLVIGVLAYAGTAYVYDTNFKGRVIVRSTDASITCATATASGEMCVNGDFETNGALDVAGAATLRAAATVGTTLAVTGASTFTGDVTANTIKRTGTIVDFTKAPATQLFAKSTMLTVTAANAQQDIFYAGYPPKYFELAQGVGATGANTLLAANGLTVSAAGWLLILDNSATDSLEITEGIIAGSAHSYIVGTDAASCTAVFYIPTRATITHLGFGLRKLGAYATANTAAEWATAYDDKAMIGITDNAGVLETDTSKATVDVETALTHAAAANADLLALQVNMTAAGAVTYKVGHTTPAGTSFAQMQTALPLAIADLAVDASAVAFTATGAAVLVPSIIIGASAGGAPDLTIVYYDCH